MHARDAWSGTFEHIFETLDTPRTDCPMKLPDLPEYTAEALEKQRALPLNEHLQIQVDFYCKFNYHPFVVGEVERDVCGKEMKTQFEASVFIEHEAKKFMKRLKSSVQGN